QQALELLVPAELVGALGLPQRGGFLQNQNRRLKIVQDGGGLRVAQGDVLVHGGGHGAAVQHGQVGLHAGGHGGLFFAPLFGQRRPQQRRRVGGRAEQYLPRGAEVELFQRVLPPLGGQIKAVQAVDLVVPELDAGRGFHVGGVNDHNVAADGKLAGAVHPVAADV